MRKRRKRTPRRYKTLLALAVVGGPLIWLLFTRDGQRRTDLVLLPLFGRPVVQLSLTDLNARLTEDDIRAKLPKVDLRCSQGETPFGDRLCAARIAALGRLPADALAFYFSSGALRAAKLTYRSDVHGELLTALSRRLGEGETVKRGAMEEGTAGVVSWAVMDGVLLANAGDLVPGEEPALLWLSGVAVERRLDATRGWGPGRYRAGAE
jgi:hypothetical protein